VCSSSTIDFPLENPAPERIVAGRYVLYGPIATGGMATVCFGRLIGPVGFARTVAIKKLRHEHLETPEVVSTLIDEARLASRIRHPNVVATLDMLAEDDEVLLVMEYVPGESLARLLATLRDKSQRMDVPVAAGIITGVLDGLHAAHEARDEQGEPLGIVHRDVTPENILVGSDGLARLLDFGIAKGKGRLQTTRAGQLKGKVSYMAPEQLLGEPPDRRSDVYAAAVVFWEMLTGKHLFPPGETEADNVHLIGRILEADLEPPSAVMRGIPRTLDPVIMRGLNREPEARYATAREFALAIEHASGVATPRRVADWIEPIVGDVLRSRAAELLAIERSADQDYDAAPMVETSVRRQRSRRLASSSTVKTDPEPWRFREEQTERDVTDLAKTLELLDEETKEEPRTLEDVTLDRRDPEEFVKTAVYAPPPEKIKPSAVPQRDETVDLPVKRSNLLPWLIAALLLIGVAAALWLRAQ